MRKAPIDLQELQRRISLKAKSESSWRFWGLYVHVCKPEVLAQAYRLSKVNSGAAGIDGKTFEQIEEAGLESFLEGIRAELIARTYEPEKNRRVEIPKGNERATCRQNYGGSGMPSGCRSLAPVVSRCRRLRHDLRL